MKNLLLLGVVGLIASCSAFLKPVDKEFRYLEDNCIKTTNRRFIINGQENPSSNSMESFIHIMEKLERRYQDLPLEELLELILANFHADEVKFNSNGEAYMTSGHLKSLGILQQFYKDGAADLDPSKYQEGTLSPDEECLLFYMLSHRILPKEFSHNSPFPLGVRDRTSPVQNKTSVPHVEALSAEQLENPHEYGIVSLKSSENEAIALGKVLLGIFIGMKQDGPDVTRMTLQQMADSRRFTSLNTQFIQTHAPDLANENFNPLFTATLADMLAMSAIKMNNTPQFNSLGKWDSGACSTTYTLERPLISADDTDHPSVASLKGGLDGLILGSRARDFLRNGVKLSQYLRMYYQPAKSFQSQQINVCRRNEHRSTVEDLEKQVRLHVVVLTALSSEGKPENNLGRVSNIITTFESHINRKDETICPALVPTNSNPGCSTPMDLFVVAQQQGSNIESEKNWDFQGNVTGILANMGGFRETEGYLTVLVDDQMGNKLQEVSKHSNEIGCAGCSLKYYRGSRTGTTEDKVFEFLKNHIAELKRERIDENGQSNNHPKFSYDNGNREEGGFPSVAALYFHYGDLKQTSTNEIKKDISKLFYDHPEVTVFVVTDNPEKFNFWSNDHKFKVIPSNNGDSQRMAKDLWEKLCYVPANFRYPKCEKSQSNWQPKYEGSIAGDQIQFWQMQPEYFHRSRNIEFKFSQEGDNSLEVCYNRYTLDPSKEQKNCKPDELRGKDLIFKMSNPCKSKKVTACEPFFFTIKSRPKGEVITGESCKDEVCRSPEYSKFEVSHHGIQCSGAFGIAYSANILLLLAVASRSLWAFL